MFTPNTRRSNTLFPSSTNVYAAKISILANRFSLVDYILFMKLFFTTFLFISFVLIFNTSWAKEPIIVKVGATEFPPYIIVTDTGEVTGIVRETIDYMNSVQTDYKFIAIPASAMRRHENFKKRFFDVSFYDNIEWGWDKSLAEASKVFMRGKEVYIARSKPGRGEEYFSDLKNKTMVGILGYHYGFANFNSDPVYLRKTFNMQSSTSNESSIKMILYDRGDIAVVSDAYLNWYLTQHPDAREKLLISKKVDQNYSHTIIVRKDIRPTIAEINKLLTMFRHSKEFKSIETRYGVTP
jgi:ABC-type amino acid transport substrate-binding protein